MSKIEKRLVFKVVTCPTTSITKETICKPAWPSAPQQLDYQIDKTTVAQKGKPIFVYTTYRQANRDYGLFYNGVNSDRYKAILLCIATNVSRNSHTDCGGFTTDDNKAFADSVTPIRLADEYDDLTELTKTLLYKAKPKNGSLVYTLSRDKQEIDHLLVKLEKDEYCLVALDGKAGQISRRFKATNRELTEDFLNSRKVYLRVAGYEISYGN